MRDFSQNHDWLSINTATVRKQSGAEVPLDRIVDQCAERGIRAISPWRDQVAAVGIDKIARQLKAHGIGLSGYCRGGFFPAPDAAGLKAALDDNRRAIDEAKTLDAPCLVLVVGALPGALDGKAAYKDIARARAEVRDGIAASLEYARSRDFEAPRKQIKKEIKDDAKKLAAVQAKLDAVSKREDSLLEELEALKSVKKPELLLMLKKNEIGTPFCAKL